MTLEGVQRLGLRDGTRLVSHYNDWETVEEVSCVRDCGYRRKYRMRMRQVKRWKEELFGKSFEGVHWEAVGCAEVVIEVERLKKKLFL